MTAVPTANSPTKQRQTQQQNMTTMVNKVDDFLEAFPNKIIKHRGWLDYEILNNIKTALKRNFATVPCTLGGGEHGYLGAILTTVEYAAASYNSHQKWLRIG